MSDLRPALEDERLRRLLEYWELRRGDRSMPARRDMDPVDMSYVLGYILLVEVHHEPLRFRYRLVGTLTPRRQNIDLTGMWVHELPFPQLRAELQANYTALVGLRRPTALKRDEQLDGNRLRWEVLALPLAADGETVDMLMIAVIERPV
jgi:hypothetical protein